MAAMTDPRSDAELIALANAGGDAGRRAYEALYHRHRDWVYSLALRFTRQHETALDVTQDVFLYFLRKFPGFELTAKLTTFFYPAVKNLAITHREKARRFTGNEEALALVPDESGNENDGRTEMAAMMGALSEGHREVVLLRFVDGLSMLEIAQALSLPVGTVKSRLHNALAALKNDERAKKFFES